MTATAIFIAFGRTQKGHTIDFQNKTKLPSFMGGTNLIPYITQDIQDKTKPKYHFDAKSRKTSGYVAELIPILCDMYLTARRDGVLHQKQKHLAELSEMINSSLAKVGITALIDEATGYQGIRPRDALQALLDKYLRKEFAAWAKKFPDEFYVQLFRLKGWNINTENFTKRPGIVGSITNDLIYNRLAPEILTQLEKSNPKVGKYRVHNHHQFLTEDIGNLALAKHLHTVIAFMKGFNSWAEFQKVFNRAVPIQTLKTFQKENNI